MIKGSRTRDFLLQVFFHESVSPGLMSIPLGPVQNFFENSRRYFRKNVYHRCQRAPPAISFSPVSILTVTMYKYDHPCPPLTLDSLSFYFSHTYFFSFTSHRLFLLPNTRSSSQSTVPTLSCCMSSLFGVSDNNL